MRALLLSLMLAACASPSTATTVLDPEELDTGDLGAVEVTRVALDGETLWVAVADTILERNQGLRQIDDLGDLGGMLFSWGGETVASSFTMQDTLIELDIAFFDVDGRYLNGFRMTPCDTDCPPYTAGVAYAYALETPAGTLPGLGPGSVLVLER